MPGAAKHVMPHTARPETLAASPYSPHAEIAHRTFNRSRLWVIRPGGSPRTSGGMVREDESRLEPIERDAEDDEPGGFQPDWPHLSELDLGVCIEPSVLRAPSREGEEE
jgi:hypothetical protein